MNTMITFISLIAGLCILFYAMGIDQDSNVLLTLLLNPQSISVSDFWNSLFISLGATGIGLILGYVYKNAELAVMFIVTPLVASQLFYFTNVIAIIMSAYPIVGILILAPMSYLFLITLIEYFRGRD